ncbi:hypothetical protein BGX23_012457 [Mortierella sp. AD031]|nr:hypothetical protein BGX23_012457 [Mortierella sp. AD031]
MAQGQEPEDGQESFLEKILDSDWAETVVGNLLSYVLRDSTSARGPTAHKSKSQVALAEAVLIFKEFKILYSGFKAVNPSNIPLGVVIDDLAPKMEKLAFDPADLPEVEQHAEDNGDDDGTTLEDDADEEDPKKKSKKIDFQPRHIQSCWSHLMKLPAASRPRFCLQPKMTDSFIDIREEGLMRILWGKDAGQVGQIWSGGSHTHDWAKEQVDTSFGNLIKMLFIGNRDTIRLASKQQKTYGKRTTTMDERAAAHPDIYDQGPLARYLTDRINYRLRHNESISAQSSSSSATTTMALPSPSLPPLPTPPPGAGVFRYALNNFIRTNGHQLQLLAYELTKNRKAPCHKDFLQRIGNQYLIRQSIMDAFGENMESVVVIRIDPGEVVSGAFCMRLTDGTVVSLLMKRASLHADDEDKPTSLFSVHDLENALHSTTYEAWDAVVSAQRQYVELEPILHGFYSSSDWKEAAYRYRMAKLSEMDMAVAGVLRLVDEALEGIPVKERRVLFADGNGTFKSGLNLTSVHTTFLRRLLQKSMALGYKAALVDEYLTSTVCPICVSKGERTRLAKPSMRVCACLECQRWIHSDLVSAHNIAIIGEHYLRSLGRPEPLTRSPIQTNLYR